MHHGEARTKQASVPSKIKGGHMDEFELFGTEIEAIAFIRGLQAAIELQGDDFLAVEPTPTRMTATEWRVNYGNS
jgi:hypothetical protein